MMRIKRDFIDSNSNRTRVILNAVAYVIYIASVLGISLQEYTTWGLLINELASIVSNPAQVGLILIGTVGFFTSLKGDL